MTNSSIFITQLQDIVDEFRKMSSQSRFSDSDLSDLSDEVLFNLISKSRATIQRVAGSSSEYYKDVIETLAINRIHEGQKLQRIIGVVNALKSDLENGYLITFQNLVQAEVFSDYLEMAEYLLKENYKDAAAVIVGSTLEAHLKELCKSNTIALTTVNGSGKTIPKKAEVLNQELAKANVFSLGYQKQITAWLDIRNSAAHGNYTDYTTDMVKLMLEGIRQFILTTK